MTSPAALVPVLPFKRISRDDEMFSESRNRVIRSSVVGKTLKSAAFVMYIEDSSTMTENVMLAEISTSRRIDGSGMIMASTMPSTASGMASSLQFKEFKTGRHPAWIGAVLAVLTV